MSGGRRHGGFSAGRGFDREKVNFEGRTRGWARAVVLGEGLVGDGGAASPSLPRNAKACDGSPQDRFLVGDPRPSDGQAAAGGGRVRGEPVRAAVVERRGVPVAPNRGFRAMASRAPAPPLALISTESSRCGPSEDGAHGNFFFFFCVFLFSWCEAVKI